MQSRVESTFLADCMTSCLLQQRKEFFLLNVEVLSLKQHNILLLRSITSSQGPLNLLKGVRLSGGGRLSRIKIWISSRHWNICWMSKGWCSIVHWWKVPRIRLIPLEIRDRHQCIYHSAPLLGTCGVAMDPELGIRLESSFPNWRLEWKRLVCLFFNI